MIAPAGRFGLVQLQQMDNVGMGAEAAAAHADAAFITEDGGHEEVGHAFDVERDDADLLGRPRRVGLAIEADARQAAQSLQCVSHQLRLVGGDGVHAHRHQRPRGHSHGHRADNVGAAGLVAVGRAGPMHVVEGDDVDRAAATVLRRLAQEDLARADQRPGAERRVHLVRRQGHEVEVLRVVVGAHVHPAVRR